MTSLFCPSRVTVQEHHQGKEDQHHRLYAAHVGAVLIQLGGSDQREDRGAGGGETEDRQTVGSDVAQVSVQQRKLSHNRDDKTVASGSYSSGISTITIE